MIMSVAASVSRVLVVSYIPNQQLSVSSPTVVLVTARAAPVVSCTHFRATCLLVSANSVGATAPVLVASSITYTNLRLLSQEL